MTGSYKVIEKTTEILTNIKTPFRPFLEEISIIHSEGCVRVEVNQITKNFISWELLGGRIVHIVMNCVTRLIQLNNKTSLD